MKHIFIATLITLCATHAFSQSLSWWLLPGSFDYLPFEAEEDTTGQWTEIWFRNSKDESGTPRMFMEQAPGARWAGLNPDSKGNPSQVVLVFADRDVIWFSGDKAKTGKIQDSQVVWSDGSKQSILENRKRRRSRAGRGKAINFGKVTVPPLQRVTPPYNHWVAESLDAFLAKISLKPDQIPSPRELSSIAQLSEADGSALGFRYRSSCGYEERKQIEDVLLKYVEPKLTCWAEQNSERALRLMGALIQHPMIDCNTRKSKKCGTASVPLVEEFFALSPSITLNLNACEDELGETLLHEVLHIGGVKDSDGDMEKAVTQSHSCASLPAVLTFDFPSEPFVNELQVNTRMFLFNKIRDESAKWGWDEGERNFMLGTICSKMGDKFCAHRYFKLATDSSLSGNFILPEGGSAALKDVAYLQNFESINEDVPRMHELVKYLKHDPSGFLLRRLETPEHRLHEFFVARSALEDVKNNRGVCSSEIDERILCEDLADIVKTPWFKSH